MRFSFRFASCPLLLLMLCLSACSQASRPQVENTDMLLTGEGRGVALVDAQLPQHEYTLMQKIFGKKPMTPTWWDRHLQISADAPVPDGATSHVEATMLARAKVRDKALDALLAKAAELPNQIGNRSIAEEIASDPAIRTSTADVIIKNVKIVRGSTLDDETAYRVVMQLPLWHLTRHLYDIPDDKWISGKSKPDSPADDEALRLARIDAESHVRRQLENYPIGAWTIGQLVDDNPVLWSQLRSCLSNAEITNTVFPEPGACEVTLRVDITELYAAARAESGRLR